MRACLNLLLMLVFLMGPLLGHSLAVCVDQRGTLRFGPDGSILNGSRGDWVSVFVYDGLGRLTQKRSRWVNAADELPQDEHCYDGVRRRQTSLAASPRTRWRRGWGTARRSRRSTT